MSEPRWLNHDESKSWRPLSALLFVLPPHLEEAVQVHGLTYYEYYVLVVLSTAPERTMPMSDLAMLANGSLSRTSHGARRLERRGLLRRHRCPEDGRVTLVTLTDEGHDLLVAAAPAHVESVRKAVFDVLDPDEAAELGRLAAKVINEINPTGPWARAKTST